MPTKLAFCECAALSAEQKAVFHHQVKKTTMHFFNEKYGLKKWLLAQPQSKSSGGV
jgi:hypothetical protein